MLAYMQIINHDDFLKRYNIVEDFLSELKSKVYINWFIKIIATFFQICPDWLLIVAILSCWVRYAPYVFELVASLEIQDGEL